jgi:hypothetical protein
LAPLYIGTAYIEAGTTITMPTGQWVPPVAADPVDQNAIQDFWNAGVQIMGLVRTQFSTLPVAPPQVYWQPVNPALGQLSAYQLTGAGASLGPKAMSNRGALP